MSVIRYAIADDHKIFRHGVIKLALGDAPELNCVGEAANGRELLQLIEEQQPDVVLLDLKMPGMDGMEALAAIRSNNTCLKILILTMYDDEHFIINLMEAGANGYLLKNAEPEEIKAAIHAVHYNEYYFNDLVSTTLLRKIVQKTSLAPGNAKAVQLNEKEAQVLRLICQEHTAAEIAKEIFLSQRTVEGIRSALLEKTGARNTAGLVIFAMKNGIFSV